MQPRLRRARATAALVLALGLVSAPHVVGSPPAQAAAGGVAVDERYPAPASGVYTVQGRGYGHGRGMSQHGAQGAALRGLTHEQILAFYYPGTKLERAAQRIRVLITADTTDAVEVLHQSGLRVRDLGAGVGHAVPTNLGATSWRLTTNARNVAVVDYLAGGRWHRWAPGGSRFLRGEGEFRAAAPITLVTPAGRRSYRGSLRAAAPSPGSTARDTVNVVGLDNYVRGVVAAEMPALWSPEAVQAQTVAARSYGVWHSARRADGHHQICDTTACQVYGGATAEHPAGNVAVTATAKQVLTYGGAPAFTEFSSSSGGWTVASAVPYQVAKADPHDTWPGNPHQSWSTKVSVASIQRSYPALGRLLGVRVVARDGNGLWKGRVGRLILDGTLKDVALTGDDARWAFGLKSTWFRL